MTSSVEEDCLRWNEGRCLPKQQWGAPTRGWALPLVTPAHRTGTALGQSENSCSRSVFIWGLRAPWVELRSGLRPAALKLNFCSWVGGGRVGGLCGICWWDVLQGLLFSLPGGNWGLFCSKPPADGALTGGWLCPGLYWWLHLGSVTAESHKGITTPKYEPELTRLASHIVALTAAVCLYSVTIRWTLTSKQLRTFCVLHLSFIFL